MKVEVFPKPVLQSYVSTLNDQCEQMSHWHDERGVSVLRQVVNELQALLDDPGNVWVTAAECARIVDTSEETIRRWCRTNKAWFRFRKREDGRYEILLSDLMKGAP